MRVGVAVPPTCGTLPCAVMSRLLHLVVLVGLVAACAGPADPDPKIQERFAAAAAPLLNAHDRLDEYDRAVAEEGDYARARALWPDVADDVSGTVEAYAPASAPLDPAQRATLVGYLGGLRAGLDAWEQVDVAIRARQAGAETDVEARVATARDHMRFLDDLRADAFGARRASLRPAP